MDIVNMSKQNKEAYNRGVKAAGIWKQLKNFLANWDQRCTMWTRNHNAPEWVGRIPSVIAILASLTGIIAGGLFIALIVLFIWAIAFILRNADFSDIQVSESSVDKKSDFYDDFIMNSAINNEYDGAPYKSPSED